MNKRRYITIAELESYADIQVTDTAEAYEYMDLAEEMVDQYVNWQVRFVQAEERGIATGGTTTTLIDDSVDSVLNDFEDDYFTFCRIEIIGGTNAGQSRTVIAYDKSEATVTVDEAFTSAIDSTSVYRIYQLGKFPRLHDHWYDDDSRVYYKYIPEEVKRATLAQIKYIIDKGLDYFISGTGQMKSESIGDYSYTKGTTAQSDQASLISPQAKLHLKSVINKTGRMYMRNPR